MRFCAADSNICYLLNNKDTLYRSDNVLAASPTFTKMKMPSATSATGFITTSKNRSNLVYVSANSKLYESKDKGATWNDITYNLPAATNIMGLVHDDYSPADRLFVASGTGVYYKDSADISWTLIPGYPTITPLNELMIYDDGTSASVLRVATYGRGVWECPIHNDQKPLIAGVKVDKQHICPGDTVHYSLNYYGQPASVTWSFPGGSPSSSSALNPAVVYGTAGTYNAQVIISNAAGSDTLLKTAIITANNTATTTLSENFEKNIFPPANWILPQPIPIYGWHITDKVGAKAASTHSLVFDNYDYDANGKQNNFVTSPMDLTGKTKASVTFDMAYQYTNGYNDSLLVAVSTNCGDSWTTLYTNGGLYMSTNIQAPVLLSGAAAFSPSPTQWRTDTISLNAYLGQTVLLSFINIGHGGSTLYLDNINLLTKGVNVQNTNGNSPDISVFPNPTTGIIYIKGSALSAQKMNITCYNIIGEVVRVQENAINSGSLQTTLNLSGLPAGVYQLKLQSDDGFIYYSKIALQ
jgi:PKD repeat protein